jgi:hypothetical protein
MKDAIRGRAAAWGRRYWPHGLFGILLTLAVLVALGVFSSPHARKWVELKVGGPHGTHVVTIKVPAAAVKQTEGLDGHEGARDETPPHAPAAALNAAQQQQDALAATDQLPIVTPDAAPEQRGCRTELVQNFSTRRGVRPRAFALHYTVSPNIPGWADVNSVVHEFDTWAFQASSNYVIDGEGHCAYIVRESDKAWTQAAYNPLMMSVEVINSGHEPVYAAPPGLAKIGLVLSDALCRWEIPVQLGAVSGGVVTRPGILDHAALGIMGGGHHDITPYSVPQVIAAVKAARAKYGCGHAPKPKPVPKPKPKLTAPAVLRAKSGEWSWIAWRFGQAAWRGYAHADLEVRPRVAAAVPAGWWRDAAKHAGATS